MAIALLVYKFMKKASKDLILWLLPLINSHELTSVYVIGKGW